MGRVTNLILDALFPRTCVSCQRKGQLLCDSCGPEVLGECPPWTPEHVAFAWYAKPVVRKLIDAWKFHGDLSAERLLAEHIRQRLPRLTEHFALHLPGAPVLVPTPLTRRRYAERGFNQAERLAQLLGRQLSLPVEKYFYRRGKSIHLAHLATREERVSALTSQRITVIGRPPPCVLLIDDVYTTGTTTNHLRELLLRAGTQHVVTVTFAKS